MLVKRNPHNLQTSKKLMKDKNKTSKIPKLAFHADIFCFTLFNGSSEYKINNLEIKLNYRCCANRIK